MPRPTTTIAKAGAMLLLAAAAVASPSWANAQVPAASPPAAEAASATRRLSPALPLKRDGASDLSADKVLVATTVLLALALGAGYLLLRRNGGLAAGMSARWGGRNAAAVRSSGRLPLSQHASVHVVQWGDEELLLGTTAQQVTLLAKRPLPAPAETVRHGSAT